MKKKKKLTKEEYLNICMEVLKDGGIDISGNTIELNDGDLGLILNPNYKYYEYVGGFSRAGIAEYVAEKLNKKIKWTEN